MEDKDLLGIYEVLNGAYGDVLDNIAMWQCIAALGVKPTFLKHLRKWMFSYSDRQPYGEDKEIRGTGDTIYDAAVDFYSNIKIEKK